MRGPLQTAEILCQTRLGNQKNSQSASILTRKLAVDIHYTKE